MSAQTGCSRHTYGVLARVPASELTRLCVSVRRNDITTLLPTLAPIVSMNRLLNDIEKRIEEFECNNQSISNIFDRPDIVVNQEIRTPSEVELKSRSRSHSVDSQTRYHDRHRKNRGASKNKYSKRSLTSSVFWQRNAFPSSLRRRRSADRSSSIRINKSRDRDLYTRKRIEKDNSSRRSSSRHRSLSAPSSSRNKGRGHSRRRNRRSSPGRRSSEKSSSRNRSRSRDSSRVRETYKFERDEYHRQYASKRRKSPHSTHRNRSTDKSRRSRSTYSRRSSRSPGRNSSRYYRRSPRSPEIDESPRHSRRRRRGSQSRSPPRVDMGFEYYGGIPGPEFWMHPGIIRPRYPAPRFYPPAFYPRGIPTVAPIRFPPRYPIMHPLVPDYNSLQKFKRIPVSGKENRSNADEPGKSNNENTNRSTNEDVDNPLEEIVCEVRNEDVKTTSS